MSPGRLDAPEHAASALDFSHPPASPMEAFRRWFDAAHEATALPNPNAMSVATIDPDGRPSVRVVLCRGFDERGIVFYTNRQSRTGEALRAHPRACANFHWDPLDRQVRIEGSVTHTSEAESDAYWNSRPRENRVNACASQQSRPIGSRAALEAAVREVEERYAGKDIPRPPHWGGFRIAPERVEFWQGHKHRLHDRMAYVRRDDGTFECVRLCP
ncbi:MAG: pyridoxamine 5'-phosphate oxidase [Planctomycetota bacterium]